MAYTHDPSIWHDMKREYAEERMRSARLYREIRAKSPALARTIWKLQRKLAGDVVAGIERALIGREA